MYLFYYVIFIYMGIFKSGNCQSHAYIQVDSEIKYLVDGVSVSMNEDLSGENEQGFDNIYEDRMLSKNYLIYDPPFLDFKEHPAGIPIMKKVYVQNTSPDTNIHLHSLSGNTMHFHCTFFQDKVISPGGNTSFDVVFLGREEGFIENTIYIHTSVGTYRYWVKAFGTPHPYRVRPLIGVRMPLNSSYTPLIQVHNPHDKNLKVDMVYSTGGDLHLELADSSQEARGDNWQISPYQTKTLIKATFVARRESNHTAYIRVQLAPPITGDVVIPIEVEVSSEHGLFFPGDALHFGFLTPNDPPVSLPLYLLNSAPKHIHIQNIITSTVNDAISIDFKPIKIPPGTVHPTQVATVTFDPSKSTNGLKVSGKLLVKCKISAYKLSVPFAVDLHQGSLLYNSSVTQFYSGSVETVTSSSKLNEAMIEASPNSIENPSLARSDKGSLDPHKSEETHELILRNTFKFAVVIHNISIPDKAIPHFKVKWNGPIIIRRDGNAKVAELCLLSSGSNLRFIVNITVHTNVTSIQIPLVAYNGKLTKYIPPDGNEKWLDFGTLGLGEQHDNYFYILNENPVDIRLRGWGSTLSNSAVELMGIIEGNFTDLRRKTPNQTFPSKSLFLKPNHYAVFRIGILTPNNEGIFVAECFVRTQYEVIKFSFRLRTAEGFLSIFPETILLEDSFPGKISEQKLHILSTFSHSMAVEGLHAEILDPRLTFVMPKSLSSQPTIEPDQQSYVGKILYEPSTTCEPQCYSGFSLQSKVGQQWTSTFPLNSHTSDVDMSLFMSRRKIYKEQTSHSYNVSLRLDTSEVRGYKFAATVNLIWPHFVPVREVHFPLTQVQNTTYEIFSITNPSSEPVVAQLLFLHHYPSPQSLVPVLQDILGNENGTWKDNLESVSEVFRLLDPNPVSPCNTCDGSERFQSANVHSNSIESNLSGIHHNVRRSFEARFKTRVAKDSLPIYLLPNSQSDVQLSFMPLEERKYSTVIVLRNNLTVLEAVVLSGEGGRGRITFRQTLSKFPSYFHFSIQERNLKNCSSSQTSLENDSIYSLRQTFLAQNDGKLPVHLYDFHIGNVPCQNYGFRVMNCSQFSLQPSESRRIDLAFTPDFSLFHVEQVLTIQTSLSGISSSVSRNKKENVTLDANGRMLLRLMANISPHAVAKCSEKLPRPSWEPLLYYSVVTILVAMLLGTILRAVLEAEHTLRTAFVPMTSALPLDHSISAFDRSKIFDLQAISRTECSSYKSLSNDSRSNQNIKTSIDGTKKHNSLSDLDPISSSNMAFVASKSKLARSLSNGYSYDNCLTNSTCTNKKLQGKDKKIPLGISSLFSLPFGLQEEPSLNTSTKQISKQRRNSIRELTVENNYNSFDSGKMHNDEEISSTTTDSSSVDDVFVYVKNNGHKLEEKSQKRKGSTKSITNNSKDLDYIVKDNSITCLDTGFEITTKCKGIKKIKETSHKKNVNNALELPYTLKPSKVFSESDQDKDRITSTKHIRVKNTSPTEKVCSSSQNRREREESTSSPDPPKSAPKAIIAPSTRSVPQNQPLAPRDPLYSSIVLGSKKQDKITPVGKILPEVKKVEKCLGAIGQKPTTVSNGLFHQSFTSSPLMGSLAPSVSSSSSFAQQDLQALGLRNNHSFYMGSLSPVPQPRITPPQAISSHSWDPKTLSSPSSSLSHLANPRDPLRPHPTMSDDDWLPFGAPNFPSSVWGSSICGGNCSDVDSVMPTDKPVQNSSAPSPSLWESLSSFSIWSSPWSADAAPLGGSSLIGSGGSLWPTSQGSSYDISGSRIPPMDNFDSCHKREKDKDMAM